MDDEQQVPESGESRSRQHAVAGSPPAYVDSPLTRVWRGTGSNGQEAASQIARLREERWAENGSKRRWWRSR